MERPNPIEDFALEGEVALPGVVDEGKSTLNASRNTQLSALQQSIAANLQAQAAASLVSSNITAVPILQHQGIPLINPALLPFLQGSLNPVVSQPPLAANLAAAQTAAINIPLAALAAQGNGPNLAAAGLSNASLGNQAILANFGLAHATNPQASVGTGNANTYDLLQAMSTNNRLGSTATNSLGATADQEVTQQQLASLRQNLLEELGRRQAEDQLAYTEDVQGGARRNVLDDRKPPPSGPADTSDAASTLMLLQQKSPISTREFRFSELVADSPLTHIDLRGLVSDAFFVAIAQMKPCRLKEDDRVGKYKHRKLGFVGICCRHCEGQPGFGRYFPGSFDSFLNGKNCDGIVRHIIECSRCPTDIKEIIAELERRESLQTSRPKYGSRKRFFSYIWEALRSPKAEEELIAQESSSANGASSKVRDGENSHGDATIEDAGVSKNGALAASRQDSSKNDASSSGATFDCPINKEGSISWEALLSKSEIVNLEDRHLVSDTLLAALAQMRPCEVTADDRIGRCKGHRVGFMGMCCRWCGGRSGKPGYGRYFPSSIRSLAQVDSCQHIVKHVSTKCQHCPPAIRKVMLYLQQSDTAQRLRYGSRKTLFRRIWSRLHGDGSDEKAVHGNMNDKSPNDTAEGAVVSKSVKDTTDWERLLDGCTLVTSADQGLITPSQFAAMAQMTTCRLTESDRTGWYKKRELNFGGFCCRYCGGRYGRASFGRYFPNTLRSFAQTISSNTIVSHFTSYCKICPEDVRKAITDLYEVDKASQKEKEPGNAAYGSRKTFYDRVWARIHDPSAPDYQGEPVAASFANSTTKLHDIASKSNSSDTAIIGKRLAGPDTGDSNSKRQRTDGDDIKNSAEGSGDTFAF